MSISNSLLSRPVVYAALSSELALGEKCVLKNRIVMASLTRNRGVVPNEINAEYYAQRASSIGLVLGEATLIEPQGTNWIEAPGLYDKRTTEGWKKVTRAVHDAGGLIFAQLWHLGRLCHPYLQANLPNYAPSAVKAPGGTFRLLVGAPGYVTPMPIEDPSCYVELYRNAARNAKDAGFDGVELHAANGYLPNQFIDGRSNVRNDEYGRSREKFPLEVVDALASVWGHGRVGVKISPSGGYNGMLGGRADLDVYVRFVKALEHRGVAYVQVMRYLPDFSKDGEPVDIVEHIRPLLKRTKLFVNGAFSPREADEWVRDGKADAVVFGRAILGTPDFGARALRGIELNQYLDSSTYYIVRDGDPRKGYTDYPSYCELDYSENCEHHKDAGASPRL